MLDYGLTGSNYVKSYRDPMRPAGEDGRELRLPMGAVLGRCPGTRRLSELGLGPTIALPRTSARALTGPFWRIESMDIPVRPTVLGAGRKALPMFKLNASEFEEDP